MRRSLRHSRPPNKFLLAESNPERQSWPGGGDENVEDGGLRFQQSLLNTAAQGNQPVNPLIDHNIVSTQASSPVTMSTEELGEKLTALLKDRIQFQIGQQQQVSTIRLDPSLGKLEIAVQLDAGKLMVHIGANQSDVCRSLQQFSENLRQHLTAQNFMEVNVQVSSEGQRAAKTAVRSSTG